MIERKVAECGGGFVACHRTWMCVRTCRPTCSTQPCTWAEARTNTHARTPPRPVRMHACTHRASLEPSRKPT